MVLPFQARLWLLELSLGPFGFLNVSENSPKPHRVCGWRNRYHKTGSINAKKKTKHNSSCSTQTQRRGKKNALGSLPRRYTHTHTHYFFSGRICRGCKRDVEGAQRAWEVLSVTSMRGAFGKDVSVLFTSSKLSRNLVSRFAAYTLAKLNHCPGDAFWMIRSKLSSSSLQGPAISFPSQPCHQAGRTDGPQVQDSPPGPPMSPEGWHFPTV